MGHLGCADIFIGYNVKASHPNSLQLQIYYWIILTFRGLQDTFTAKPFRIASFCWHISSVYSRCFPTVDYRFLYATISIYRLINIISRLLRSARVNEKAQQGFQIELQRDVKTPWGFQLDPVALEEGSTQGGEVRSMIIMMMMTTTTTMMMVVKTWSWMVGKAQELGLW